MVQLFVKMEMEGKYHVLFILNILIYWSLTTQISKDFILAEHIPA